MAVTGVGVDIVDIERMRAALQRTPRMLHRVFTEDERQWCDHRANPAASYAGCFAVREAVLKALGVGFGDGVSYNDVSVTHDDRGRPSAVLSGRAREIADEQGVVEVYVSISHTHEVAVANAVAATEASAPRKDPRRSEAALITAQFKQARSLLDDLDRGKED